MSLWNLWKEELAPTLLPRRGAGLHKPAGPARTMALDTAATGLGCRVLSVASPDGQPDWGRWLAEIGFLPGEHVTVTVRSSWGGDPLVVRIGQSTFALRRAEAACVQVEAL
jgi:ferrous iron transport protein A